MIWKTNTYFIYRLFDIIYNTFKHQITRLDKNVHRREGSRVSGTKD